MPQLIVMSRRGASRQVSLRAPRTTLGRDAANELVIDSHRASRRHAVLIRQGADVWVRDLDSSNGTWVNQERVACCRLEHGDTIEIGDWKLRFLDHAAASQVTLALELASMQGSLPMGARASSAGSSAGWR